MKNLLEKLFDIECELSVAKELINILLEHACENNAGIAEILEIVQNKLSKIDDIIEQ